MRRLLSVKQFDARLFALEIVAHAALGDDVDRVRGIVLELFAQTADRDVHGAQGKDISGQQSNTYMSMRVGFQALTILLVILLLVIGGRGLSGG